MIVWCSDCQRFIAERAPYESLAVSYGLCRTCARAEDVVDRDLSGVEAIRTFLEKSSSELLEGTPPAPQKTLAAAREVGIRESDLLLGLLQPTLHEIGRRFEEGAVSVEQEHKVSAFVDAVLDSFPRRASADFASPRVLLMCAPGNQHRFGARLVAELLADHGVDATLRFDTPDAEVLQELSNGAYRGLGLSVALPSQTGEALRLAERARVASPGVHVAIGGYASKSRHLNEAHGVVDFVHTPAAPTTWVAAYADEVRSGN